MHRGRGELPQNKANFPKRDTEAVSLLRTADWGWSRIGSPAYALLPPACVGRLSNKPNSCHYADPEIGVPGRAKRAKQSQLRWGTPLNWPGASDTIVAQATDLIQD